MSLSFQGIRNVHAVRDSYLKLSDLYTSPYTNDIKWGEETREFDKGEDGCEAGVGGGN